MWSKQDPKGRPTVDADVAICRSNLPDQICRLWLLQQAQHIYGTPIGMRPDARILRTAVRIRKTCETGVNRLPLSVLLRLSMVVR